MSPVGDEPRIGQTETAWPAWCQRRLRGLRQVEIADLPTGRVWQLARKAATCRIFDERVAVRISRVLVQMGVNEDQFWSELAHTWAVQAHAGDVRKARRCGLGRNPAQEFLRAVNHPTYVAVTATVGVPRGEDVIAPRAGQESGRGDAV
jgi:hypothetical protein